MRLDRRPLLDTRVDAPLFVARDEEIKRLLRGIDLALNSIVVGERGVGKTSLLRQLAWQLRERGDTGPLVQASAAGAADVCGVLLRIYRALVGDEAAALASAAGLDEHALLARINAAAVDGRVTLLVDDVTPPVGRVLFGALRDELWRMRATWVVACAEADADALLQPPVDAFFEVVLPLTALPADEAAELVRRRLDGSPLDGSRLEEDDLARLVAATAGHPRRLLDLVRAAVVEDEPVAELADRLDTRVARLREVSHPAALLAAELESLGAASPSDPELQRRMGVSRPRLVALFAELRDAGLVRAAEPARDGGGPGRPKVRYVLDDTAADGQA